MGKTEECNGWMVIPIRKKTVKIKMRTRNGPQMLFNQEIALAMELRSEGCCWKYIAIGLGVYHHHLRRVVNQAEREGMK